MSLRKTGIVGGLALLLASLSRSAFALPYDYEIGFQPAASPVMQDIEDFHRLLLYIITAVSLFVLALLIWIVIRYRAGANPVPSKVHHNTLLEIAWTIIPVIILVFIAIPSFRLLYYEADIPKPALTIEAIGKQWFWTYNYPDKDAGFTYDSLGLSDAAAQAAGEPRLLGVDNVVVVPVNQVVGIDTTGADVIHSWSLPQMGVKMDAVPGRVNHTWFKATQLGTFYGQCSQLCGARHAYMPIEVKVVPQAEYEAWLSSAKKKYARIDTPDTTQVAAK
jgi:cytochrome c oxidase subunit II